MRTTEQLKAEIRVYMHTIAVATMQLKMEKRLMRKDELTYLIFESYKSICHRQGLIIEMQANDIEYGRKAA